MYPNFKYILDPLFLISSTLYILNNLLFLPLSCWDHKFINFYFNDVLLVPVILPIILFFSRIFKLREKYSPPKLIEIAIPLVIWSIAFELIGPYFFKKGTADPLDVLAYCIGGLLCWIIWNRSSFLFYCQKTAYSVLKSIPNIKQINSDPKR